MKNERSVQGYLQLTPGILDISWDSATTQQVCMFWYVHSLSKNFYFIVYMFIRAPSTKSTFTNHFHLDSQCFSRIPKHWSSGSYRSGSSP